MKMISTKYYINSVTEYSCYLGFSLDFVVFQRVDLCPATCHSNPPVLIEAALLSVAEEILQTYRQCC